MGLMNCTLQVRRTHLNNPVEILIDVNVNKNSKFRLSSHSGTACWSFATASLYFHAMVQTPHLFYRLGYWLPIISWRVIWPYAHSRENNYMIYRLLLCVPWSVPSWCVWALVWHAVCAWLWCLLCRCASWMSAVDPGLFQKCLVGVDRIMCYKG